MHSILFKYIPERATAERYKIYWEQILVSDKEIQGNRSDISWQNKTVHVNAVAISNAENTEIVRDSNILNALGNWTAPVGDSGAERHAQAC